MLIRIVAVGQRSPRWVDDAVSDYLKRFPAGLTVELVTVKTETRTGDPSRRTEAGTSALMAREAERLRAKIPPRARLIALDERGDDLRTATLANRLRQWQDNAAPVAILIGGPDGLDHTLKTTADERIRLSSLTLPHALVRVLLAEQLYRAWSINAGHPYHRE
ncbi:MAG: 23S rRNA (pseudouridine(1915)-N(3))-methyltransferase RlmH [Lautropia sp.]|nr:23S rRNA (pseudouridine(1915)-N(3))-methyltransferase RlmH [Lautropia sp.]